MKVRISTIPAPGIKISEKIPLQALNARMNEGRNNDIFFTQAPQTDILVTKTASGAQVKGKVKAKYNQPCSLCLEVIERPLEVSLDYILEPKSETESQPSLPFDRKYEDDIGITYYEGDQVELEDLIQEALILALSPFWHPPLDKKDNCTRCGKNFSQENPEGLDNKRNLGTLLKKAGVKL